MTHADLLKLLLPPSSIDPMGRAIGAELAAEGNALDLAQGAADQILDECDPRATAALLADWERVYGLPEQYVLSSGATPSFQERRAALVTKATMLGGQSKPFFVWLAATAGYSITISEGRPETTEDDSEYQVWGDEMRFVWYVNAAINTVRDLTSEDDTEMATAVWGNALLEALINRFKPAHTLALFAYL